MAHYVDTSALVRLVVQTAGSSALRRWVARTPGHIVASQVARTELMRTIRRTTPEIMPEMMEAARSLLDLMVLTVVTPAILDSAARLDPHSLRSLDAIHLASALDLGNDLESFVTYDERLAAAARRFGVTVVSPR